MELHSLPPWSDDTSSVATSTTTSTTTSHIESKDLIAQKLVPPEQSYQTSLSHRLAYTTAFIGFGEEDVKAIHNSAPILAPLVPKVVDAVYDKLFSFSVTRDTFEQYSGMKPFSVLEETKKSITGKKSSEQMKFRKDMLTNYLVKLVTCDYGDLDFLVYLDYVGKIHTAKGGNPKMIVDYIHNNALFGFVSDVIVGAILKSKKINDKVKATTIRAFNKLLWIQNDLFTKYYLKQDESPEPTHSTSSSEKEEQSL